MSIRMKIDELLERQGQSAYWLSKETGIAHSGIWKLRHGQFKAVSTDVMEKLCDALECEPADLFERVIEKSPTMKR